MVPEELISLVDVETTSAAVMSEAQDSNIPDLNPSPPHEGGPENEAVVDQLSEAQKANTVTITNVVESVVDESATTGGEIPDTESRVESGRFFDDALAQLHSDNTTVPKPIDVPSSTPRSRAKQSESEDTTAANSSDAALSTPPVDEPAPVQAPPFNSSSSRLPPQLIPLQPPLVPQHVHPNRVDQLPSRPPLPRKSESQCQRLPILPIALAHIRTDPSALQQVDLELDVCQDSDDDLEMPGYLLSP
ncbi:hypothetical protein C8R47DRAFT_1231010 [Mycena vitilis]|nr:hypothetical protein C8R47DRAFT_1231063 [Mycena vitilis]KAJ6448463.1 hypothetical protein C8R47DRAFT_1231010 [Mycena vitilis]